MSKDSATEELEEYYKTQFNDQLKNKSDRGVVLAGHAFLDFALGEMLRQHFVDDPEVVDELLRSGGAIGSFRIRCDLAYCLGSLGQDMYSDLNYIRKIRNKYFAHSYQPANFKTQNVLDLVDNLRLPDLNDPNRQQKPRVRFIESVSLLAARFMSLARKQEHCAVGPDYKVVVARLSASGVVASGQRQL